MCRIFGISYGADEECIPVEKIGRVLYRHLVQGGPHSWGWMRYDGSDITFYKEPGRADTREAQTLFTNEVQGGSTKWLVGHVRYATHGAPENNVNNHPLMHGSIIGVHNGVLRNHDDVLSITGREDATAIVDSEAIMAAVNKWGHAPGLRKIVGDMVTVYADIRKPQLLHIARSYGRSLSLGWTTRGNFIFASTRDSLLLLEGYGIKFEGLSSVREMRHLVIKDGKIIYRHTYGEVPDEATTTWPAATRGFTSLHPPVPHLTTPRRARETHYTADDFMGGDFGQKVDNDTYYYNGKLMTADEYVDVLCDELEWNF